MSPEEARIVDEVARLGVADLDQPWDRAVLEFRALSGSAEFGRSVYRGGDQLEDFPPDGSISPLFELRRLMYVPGAGTWFSVEVDVTPDLRAATRFGYDTEPAWYLPRDDETYVDDLALFPRDEEHLPDWLRQKVVRAGSERELDWSGLRFQASFTRDGRLSTSLDFHPPPGAGRWAADIVGRLAAQGIHARVGHSVDDESGVTYPDVRVRLGDGYCSVAFWADDIFWSVDVAASQSDPHTARHAVTAVREVVGDVTGWTFVDAKVTTGYERAMLGLPR
ncbi:hypothetical protein [Actinoplanes auranticolor]|uniref:Uncharacterized protein n=1 Tax=Actinoplanes auranticolor TaxID=47988 RepID=A0A919SIH9_9ACTN|nr:hypothetical protein [Actinoplanes auranticolor]GIM71313.1 hypothetical protein Aau02nite_45380 [Actinoplanes auranticolor]